MTNMIGIYFSGTGNSKYALEIFLKELHAQKNMYSIEEEAAVSEIKKHKTIIFSYPVQFSNIPRIVRDFIAANAGLWKGKKVFVIATMGLFSGDGSGMLARLLNQYGAKAVGGLHVKMPDSIADEKLLKRTPAKNRSLVASAEKRLENVPGLSKLAVRRRKESDFSAIWLACSDKGCGFITR